MKNSFDLEEGEMVRIIDGAHQGRPAQIRGVMSKWRYRVVLVGMHYQQRTVVVHAKDVQHTFTF